MKINGNDTIWKHESYAVTIDNNLYYIWQKYGIKYLLVGICHSKKEFDEVIKLLDNDYDEDFIGEYQ